MNLGNVTNGVSKAASGANAASGASNAVGRVNPQGVAPATPNPVGNPGNPVGNPANPANPDGMEMPSKKTPLQNAIEESPLNEVIGTKEPDKTLAPKMTEAIPGEEGEVPPTQETSGGKKVFQDEKGREFKEGDKVEPGKQVDENGQVKDSSTKKLTRVAGQAAAAYFTGGQSLGTDQQVMNNRLVDKTIGAETLDKVPGVEQISSELDEAGVTDAVGDTLNVAGDLKNGDIAKVAEDAGKVKEDAKKAKKYVAKKMIPIILLSAIPLLFTLIVTVAVIGPVIGGFIDITDRIEEKLDDIADFFGDLFGGSGPDVALSEWVPGFDSLSFEQQRILAAAASLVGRPYKWGGKPTGAGLSGVPSTGLDCSGYVEWVLWTAYGVSPGTLSTSTISDLAKEGKRFKIISESELRPGDIGLKWLGYKDGENNHTGIYAGDGYWFHAANSKSGIIRSKYTGFTVYLRYISDNPTGSTGASSSWRQMDSSWSGVNMGSSGKTLGSIGCLVTSIAIQIDRSGANHSIIPFNPGTFVQALNRVGGFTGGGSLYWGAVSKVVPGFQYVGNVNLRGLDKSSKLAKINSYINQGYYLTCEVKGATSNAQHWVACIGTTGSGVSMIDPASNSTDMWSKYDWTKTTQFAYFRA